MPKGMIRMSSAILGGICVGFALGYAGWHLWTGEWALYDAGAFMGYSALGGGCGFWVGCAVALGVKRVRALWGRNRDC